MQVNTARETALSRGMWQTRQPLARDVANTGHRAEGAMALDLASGGTLHAGRSLYLPGARTDPVQPRDMQGLPRNAFIQR